MSDGDLKPDTYIDTFVINGVTHGIEETEGAFRMWRGGCGIGKVSSRDEARKCIHRYAVSQLRAEQQSYQQKADAAAAVLNKLGDDVFNLARFMP